HRIDPRPWRAPCAAAARPCSLAGPGARRPRLGGFDQPRRAAGLRRRRGAAFSRIFFSFRLSMSDTATTIRTILAQHARLAKDASSLTEDADLYQAGM